MRDAAFAELGDTNLSDLTVQGEAPAFVPGVCAPDDHEPDAAILRVCGTFTVPCFLDQPLCPAGSRFAFADATSNDPVRIPGNTMLANYDCIMPASATAGSNLRLALYGHGLLGDASEVDLAPQRAMVKRHGFVYCATDWKGMATEDVPNVGIDPQRPLALPDPHRPAAAGAAELPLPRPADDPPGRASPATPPSWARSTPAGCSTTATARAASTAAR